MKYSHFQNPNNMNAFNTSEFMQLRQHIKIAHHVPGRIRVRVMLSALKQLPDIDPTILESLQIEAQGIKEVRINRVAGSAVISYDTAKIPQASWETVINGEPALAEQTLLGFLNS